MGIGVITQPSDEIGSRQDQWHTVVNFDTLKKVEAAGFSEVILYFNVGLKPHQQVKEEMDRFMRKAATNFEGKHRQRQVA
jgi:hypothetical protein